MITLRPHHLIDIIASIGRGDEIKPHPYGHDVHTITKKVIDDPQIEVKFINGNDDICLPCIHLMENNLCDDVLSQLEHPISKQDYNDDLDEKLFAYLGIREGDIMKLPEYLDLIEARIPGIEKICTHPKRDEQEKLEGSIKGIEKLRSD